LIAYPLAFALPRERHVPPTDGPSRARHRSACRFATQRVEGHRRNHLGNHIVALIPSPSWHLDWGPSAPCAADWLSKPRSGGVTSRTLRYARLEPARRSPWRTMNVVNG